MPLHTSSYFAGVATVVATMALGFGGGVLMTDAFVGKSENPPTLVERRAVPLVESPANTTIPPVPAETPTAQVAASPDTAAPAPVSQAPQVATRSAAPMQVIAAPQQSVTEAAPSPPPANISPAAAQAPAPALAEPSPPRQFDQTMAKARDDEVRKNQAAERRKAERRKWAERRKQEARKRDELNAVAERVREIDREPAPPRSFFAGSPRINLFDDE
jgi:hypothetical protein